MLTLLRSMRKDTIYPSFGARPSFSKHTLLGVLSSKYGSAWNATRQYIGEAAAYVKAPGYHLCKLFDGFVVPFDYRIEHETFAGAMFVGLSERVWDSDAIPVREMDM